MAQITNNLSTTFAEYLLIPRLQKKEHKIGNVSLQTPLLKYKKCERSRIYLNTPFVSAAMQAVTGSELSSANAREGGLGFIFCSQPIKDQAKMISKAKDFKAGFVESKITLTPKHTLENAINITKETGYSTIPITKDAKNNSRLIGILTDQDYWEGYDSLDTKIEKLMTPFNRLKYGLDGISLSDANKILRESKKSCIPIIDNEQHLKYLVFKKDWLKHKESPLEIIDSDKRLLIGAAINTKDYKDRVPALIKAGADVFVIDTSNGYNEYVKETLGWVKKNYDIPIGAGNVVSAEGFRYLADNGADFVKIGIGGGSICITQEVKGIGRGQVAAIIDTVKERNLYFKEKGIYIPLCSDGGIIQDSHILIALAFGADFIMMGRYFARCKESPPDKILNSSGLVKPYWGEGSKRAKNWQRYHNEEKNELPFEEGVDGWVPYIDNLSDVVRKSISVIKSTMTNLGCSTIPQLHKNATLERRSPASIIEGKPHDIQINTDSTYKNLYWGQ